MIAIYQRNLDARAAVASADEARKVAMTARTQSEGERQAADKALRAWVVSRFGEGSAQALAFGFAPRAHPTTTVTTKARAHELALATRKARHTMGTRQRAPIKGVLPPVTAPAASTDATNTNGATAPGPAASAPPAATTPASTTPR